MRHIILYVEDDLDDLFIVQQAFERYGDSILLLHAPNGFVALEYLSEWQAQGQSPCLIILDMNMPGMDGRETLIRIRQSDAYRDIPVVIFTTSSHAVDKDFARKWGAHFITKPIVYDDLEALAKEFVNRCNFEISNRA